MGFYKNQHFYSKKAVTGCVLAIGFLCFIFTPVAIAATVIQSYQSNVQLGVGTVVSLSQKANNQIEDTTVSNDSRAVGVVAGSESAIIDLQPKGTNLKIVTSGDGQILVTDIDGSIKSGDLLIISPLSGVAMKDDQGQQANKYIAVAEQDFSSNSSSAKQVSVSLNNGNKKSVGVGIINANILITDRPVQKSAPKRSFLSSIGEKIVGHPVSSLRVVTSTIILLSALFITGLMLNSSVKGAFVSLGRNPLARSSIIANLMKIILVALVVFETGLVAAYLILAL